MLAKGRRLTDHANKVSVDAVLYSRHRTAAGSTNDRTGRSRFLFVLFLCVQEKNTFLSFPKEKICAFLTEEKSTKRLTETLSRTLMLLLGSVYTRLEGVAVLAKLAQATTRRAKSPYDWAVRVHRRKARAV